eukprot:268347_1
MAVKCVSLGTECSFVVSDDIDLKDNQSEEKKDEVENEWILKGDQQMNIKNGNDLRSKPFEILVRNRMLFGDMEWVMFMRRKYSAFPCYTTSFIENLRVTKDETIDTKDETIDPWRRYRGQRYHCTIELLGGMDGIDERYHSEILKAIYKAEIKKEYGNNIKHDEMHVFDGSDWANGYVKIPSNEKGKGKGKEEAFTVRIY